MGLKQVTKNTGHKQYYWLNANIHINLFKYRFFVVSVKDFKNYSIKMSFKKC